MNTNILVRVPFFHGLPPRKLEYLASTLRVLEAGPGTVLFREGEVGDEFYIVIGGKVEVVLALGTPDEKVIATLGAGEYLGEMSLLVP